MKVIDNILSLCLELIKVNLYNSKMDFPEINGISDIQETEAVTGSRTISNFSPRSIHYANL